MNSVFSRDKSMY